MFCAVVLLAFGAILASCVETDESVSTAAPGALDDFRTSGHSVFYEHEVGFCEDTNPDGIGYATERPIWSDFAGSHYEGITHTDGSSSIRYPDYENVSHNLAVLESRWNQPCLFGREIFCAAWFCARSHDEVFRSLPGKERRRRVLGEGDPAQ